MSFIINRASLKPQIQDLGIYGLKHLGVSTGGPMDGYAFHCANGLLHNDANAPQIEIALGMFRMTATAPTVIAVCGADLGFTINGNKVINWCCYDINSGDVIEFTGGNCGTRAYLAVKGGFQSEPFCGHHATIERLNIGRVLDVGETLDCPTLESMDMDASRVASYHNKCVPRSAIPDYNGDIILDVVLGYQYDDFDLEPFWDKSYYVSPSQNRMGYMIEGDPLTYQGDELISEGISMGAVQVPPNGQPIVLMSDAQSIGGYPKIGTLTSYSRWALSQCAPKKKIKFRPVTADDATCKLDTILNIKL